MTYKCPPVADHNNESTGKRRALEPLNAILENSNVAFDNFQESLNKKLKSSDPNGLPMDMEGSVRLDHSFTASSMDLELKESKENQAEIGTSNKLGSLINTDNSIEPDEGQCIQEKTEAMAISESRGCSEWKLLEKELYQKGLEIFGRNRCV